MRKTSLKEVCFGCNTFDNTQRKSYKCAIPGKCPGRDWPMSKRQRLAKAHRDKK